MLLFSQKTLFHNVIRFYNLIMFLFSRLIRHCRDPDVTVSSRSSTGVHNAEDPPLTLTPPSRYQCMAPDRGKSGTACSVSDNLEHLVALHGRHITQKVNPSTASCQRLVVGVPRGQDGHGKGGWGSTVNTAKRGGLVRKTMQELVSQAQELMYFATDQLSLECPRPQVRNTVAWPTTPAISIPRGLGCSGFCLLSPAGPPLLSL